LTELLRLYADIAFCRRGPEDLPVSRAVLWVTVGGYAAITFILSSLLPPSPGDWADHLALDVAFQLGWYWLLLKLLHRPERFLQTTSALFGYQAILAPLWIASVWLLARFHADARALLPISFLWLGLFIWLLSVNVRILRSALEWPLFGCVTLVLLQSIAELLVFKLLPVMPVGAAALPVGAAVG
jgi:hypothetical protein